MKSKAKLTPFILLFCLWASVPSWANEEIDRVWPIATGKAEPIGSVDKPGFYRLDKSTNNKVCLPLSRTINADLKNYGKTRFDLHREFVKWRDVEEERIDRGREQKYSESVEQAYVDINNDGVTEKVIRTKWSIGGALNDVLNIFPMSEQKVIIAELLTSDKKIIFNSGNYWLDRHRKKYGISNEDWLFDGVASINLLQQNNETYVVAQNYAYPSNISAKIYVFKFDQSYQENDVCMFVKICPCGGCKDLRGDDVTKTMPAKKWCRKTHI